MKEKTEKNYQYNTLDAPTSVDQRQRQFLHRISKEVKGKQVTQNQYTIGKCFLNFSLTGKSKVPMTSKIMAPKRKNYAFIS